MSKETGGNAFPYSGEHTMYGAMGNAVKERGMSLRDYFAAKAMQGTLTNPEWNHWSTEQHVEYAYAVADAMLNARGE